jgi:hypothetical protein
MFYFSAAEGVMKDIGATNVINEDQGSQNRDERMTPFGRVMEYRLVWIHEEDPWITYIPKDSGAVSNGKKYT